jgi:hypothetical protein
LSSLANQLAVIDADAQWYLHPSKRLLVMRYRQSPRRTDFTVESARNGNRYRRVGTFSALNANVVVLLYIL